MLQAETQQHLWQLLHDGISFSCHSKRYINRVFSRMNSIN